MLVVDLHGEPCGLEGGLRVKRRVELLLEKRGLQQVEPLDHLIVTAVLQTTCDGLQVRVAAANRGQQPNLHAHRL